MEWIYLVKDRGNEALNSAGGFLQKLKNYRLLVVDSLLFVWLLAWIIILSAYLSAHIIISTAMCQQSDIAQCIFIWKSDYSHKVPLIPSSALSDIPLLTACRSTNPLYTTAINAVTAATDGWSFILVPVCWWQSLPRPGRFVCRTHSKEVNVGFSSDLQANDKRNAPYPCFVSNCLYPGHCNYWATSAPVSTT